MNDLQQYIETPVAERDYKTGLVLLEKYGKVGQLFKSNADNPSDLQRNYLNRELAVIYQQAIGSGKYKAEKLEKKTQQQEPLEQQTEQQATTTDSNETQTTQAVPEATRTPRSRNNKTPK